MMKKMLLCLCVSLLCACSSEGSCENGNLDLESTMTFIEEQILDNTWQLGMLNHEAVYQEKVQELYGDILSHCDEYLVKQAVIDIDCGEVAIFHVKDDAIEAIIQACEQRKQTLQTAFTSLPFQNNIVSNAQVLENNGYVFFVVGEDVDSLIAYFRTL